VTRGVNDLDRRSVILIGIRAGQLRLQ
jgi:hypothetical protein